jgi:hypothetical protein
MKFDNFTTDRLYDLMSFNEQINFRENVTDIAVMLNVNMESLQRHFQTLLDTKEVSERIKKFIRKNYKFNINEDERIDGN